MLIDYTSSATSITIFIQMFKSLANKSNIWNWNGSAYNGKKVNVVK